MGEIRDKVRERKRQERLQDKKERLVNNIKGRTQEDKLEDMNMSELEFLKKVLKNLDDYRTLDKFLSHK